MFWPFSLSVIRSSSCWPVLLCVLAFVVNGNAIKCFVCDSSDNQSCMDLKTNSSIVPEECTLDKMKSLDTWLFELNKFAYFDTGANKSPLMNCQKVVARDPNTSKMVTARFCQLDTGDSDACSILRSKLGIPAEEDQARSKRGTRNSDRRAEVEQFHCSICNTDRCNGSDRLTLDAMAANGSGSIVLMALLIMQCIRW